MLFTHVPVFFDEAGERWMYSAATKAGYFPGGFNILLALSLPALNLLH